MAIFECTFTANYSLVLALGFYDRRVERDLRQAPGYFG
jgi:hypothetical protein